MKKLYFLILFIPYSFVAQVGISTTDPKSQLDIKASSTTTPANTDGILIPRMSAFPAVNPGVDQNGMLIYLTTAVGSKAMGFYYWDNTTSSWLGLYSSTSTTNDVSVTNFEDFVFDEYAGNGGLTTNVPNDNQYSFSPVLTGTGTISNVDGSSTLFNSYAPSGTGGNDYVGVHHLSTGTTASGRAAVGSSDFGNRLKIGGKEIIYEIRAKFPTALASGQNYTVYLGLCDLAATGSSSFSLASTITNGVYFRYTYVGATGGTFVGVANNASTTPNVTSSTAVSSNTWYKFKVIMSVGGAADYYINDVKFGTIANANLPTAAMKFVFLIEKNLGTTAATCDIDYISWRMVR